MTRSERDNEFIVMDPDPWRRMELAIEDIRAGRMVILVDDEDRENEGDLTLAAEKVTPEAINFMATQGRGLICLSLTEARVQELGLSMMTSSNGSPYGTAFTVSIEAREGVSTGISAFDRAHTIRTAIDPARGPRDILTPGHVFPLRARAGGVLARTGQTEGSVDLARLAGLNPAGVICEIMNEDGSMARLPDLEQFGARHRVRIATVADIVRWRLRFEARVEPVFEGLLPGTGSNPLRARIYRGSADDGLHLVLIRGDMGGEPLVRVQSACLVGHLLDGVPCDCDAQLLRALGLIEREGAGVIVCTHIGGERDAARTLARIVEHLDPLASMGAEQSPSAEPEIREFGAAAQILLDLGLTRLRLLTNNPRKIVGIEAYGLRVTERIPVDVAATPSRVGFLEMQRERLGHLHARFKG